MIDPKVKRILRALHKAAEEGRLTSLDVSNQPEGSLTGTIIQAKYYTANTNKRIGVAVPPSKQKVIPR